MAELTFGQPVSLSPDAPLSGRRRIESIDVLRGIVMVVMALDHVRDFFHSAAFTEDPLNLATTTIPLYFTRWITHFCAPVFVFLSGTSIYLQSLRKSTRELSAFLIKRGLWLIFVEVAIISLAFTFNPFYNVIFLQVIWAIGISMVLMGLLVYLPFGAILAIGLAIVLGHNLLDFAEAAPDFNPGFWWNLFHSSNYGLYEFLPNHFLIILYPFVPWTGVMLLGYCAGRFFSPQWEVSRRKTYLIFLGLSLIFLFIALRFSNWYGNPSPWVPQKNGLYSLLSFINTSKYPPSLLYLCMTLGPSLILLAYLENIKNSLTERFRIFGRTAFFYYILHFYLIHLLAALNFFVQGYTVQEGIDYAVANQNPFLFTRPEVGLTLWGVYGVWLFVVVVLYPVCRWYNAYKSAHPEKWWLSYL
jgi:uncharacterized membrane protein